MAGTALVPTDGIDLVPMDEIKRQIAELTANGDGETLADGRERAVVAQLYAKRRANREMADYYGEVRVRAAAALGRLDSDANPHGVKAQFKSSVAPELLTDVGHDTRAKWRRLGQAEAAGRLDGMIEEARADESAGITEAHVLKPRLAVHQSTATDLWETPQDLFDMLDAEFGFELDVCATAENAKCERYFTEDDDGLAQTWRGVCWMNPPYGSEIGRWVEKASQSAGWGATVVCLLPARTDTGWWWDHCRHGEIRFLRGRLRFGDAEASAPFPSAVVVFGREPNALAAHWEWR